MNAKQKILEDVLQVGDVILTNTKPKWYQFWLKIAYGTIRRYQKRKYPKSGRVNDIHAKLVLETNPIRLFSYEAPKAVLQGLKINSRTLYRVCRYEPAFGPKESLPDFQLLLREASERLKGIKYDYGQLLDILVKQLFPWAVPKKFKIFDFGRKKKVCSVAVLWCFLYWWRNFWRESTMKGTRIQREELNHLPKSALKYPRPLGKQYVETCCPADFANSPKKFRVVMENV